MARKKPQKRVNNNLLARFFILAGLLLLILGTFSHFQIISNSGRAQEEFPRHNTTPQNPRNINIVSAGINIGVAEGGILNGKWILSDFEALYLPTSGKVGEGYNTIIYAHNREDLFAGLNKVKKDEFIQITDHAGRVFNYKIYEVKNINPKDIEALYSDEKDILTLFTCSGWFDEKRLLVRAKLIPLSAIQE